MAMSAAERAALWRKRQREDPLKHDKYKQKERDRYKKRKETGDIRSIHQLTPREQRIKRRTWKFHANTKRKREKMIKIALSSRVTPPNSPEHMLEPNQRNEQNRTRGRKKKNLNRTKAYKEQFKLRVKLNKERRLRNKYKQRYYRLKKSCRPDDEVENEVDQIMASKKNTKCTLTLYCLLTRNLRKRYSKSKPIEKRILKNLVFREAILRKYKIGSYTKKQTGISEPRMRLKEHKFRHQQCALRKKIEDFYQRDDNSRVKAGKKSTITRNKIKMQVRLLNDNVINLHKKYQFENTAKISYSLFCRMKPFWVIRAQEKDRETCLCRLHENPMLKLNKLYSERAVHHKDLSSLIKDITCNDKNKTCMYRTCDRCKNKKIRTSVEKNEINLGKIVQWKIWKSRRVERQKVRNGETIVSKSNVTLKETETGTIATLIDELQSEIERLARHEFNINHQYLTLKKLKETCRDNELILHVDFSENYLCKYTEEIQSVHFGASKKQISIHTGLAYLSNTTLPFATLSDNLSHGPAGIWAHLKPIIEHLKGKHPQLNQIHVISDGPTTQYRCKNNFYLFATQIFDYGFSKGGTWNFMEAGHGKGAPDGIGAVLKRSADSLVNTHNRDVTCSADLVDGLNMLKSTVWTSEIKDVDVAVQEDCIPSSITAVPETMKLHQVIVKQKGVILSRILSCFCAEECICFNPAITTFNIQLRESHVPSVESDQSQSTTELEDQEAISNKEDTLDIPGSFDESVIDRFCVVEYEGRPYPGKIVDVDETSVEVTAMHCIGQNRFFWPRIPDVIWYNVDKLITLLDGEPMLVTSRHRALEKPIWDSIVRKMNL